MNLTWDDFCQWYQNTFFRVTLPHLNKQIVVFFHGVSNSKKGTFVATSQEYNDLVLNFNSSLSVDFSPPPVRVFGHEGIVYSYERLPARQWSRGVCSNNSLISNMLQKVGLPSPKLSIPILESAWNYKHDKTIIDAVLKLKSKDIISTALSDNFWISESINDKIKEYPLWYNHRLIGHIDEKKKVIIVGCKHMVIEFIDYLRNTSQPGWSFV